MASKDLPIIETLFGEILGKEEFLTTAVDRFDRRKNGYGLEMNRKDLEGLTYAEINKIPPFDTLKQGSLSKRNMDARARLQKNDEKNNAPVQLPYTFRNNYKQFYKKMFFQEFFVCRLWYSCRNMAIMIPKFQRLTIMIIK